MLAWPLLGCCRRMGEVTLLIVELMDMAVAKAAERFL